MFRLRISPSRAKLVLLAALAAVAMVGVKPVAAQGPPGPGGGHFREHLPPGHNRVFMRGEPYYFHGGKFFRPVLGGFVAIFPPVGLVVAALPAGFQVVVVAGATYYLYDNVYYQAAPGGYVVVPAPATAPAVPVPPAGLVAPGQSASGAATVITPALNVRSGPGPAYPVLLVVNQGDVLLLQGRTGAWLLVRTPNGTLGWVAQEFTTQSFPPASG